LKSVSGEPPKGEHCPFVAKCLPHQLDEGLIELVIMHDMQEARLLEAAAKTLPQSNFVKRTGTSSCLPTLGDGG